MTTNNLNFNSGILLRWNNDKGYGFIEHKEHKNGIFVHITAFQHPERKPVVGDTIMYQLAVGKENKLQGVDAYINGVKRIPKITEPKPAILKIQSKDKSPIKIKSTSSYHKRPNKKPSRDTPIKNFIMLILLAAIIVSSIVKVYDFFKSRMFARPDRTIVQNVLSDNPHNFKCDGRVYCSQMNSREEARYFVAHCPGTKMRSTPGEPCKNDSRW